MEVPLSADMMVAALFAAGLFVTAGDVADDDELFGFSAQVVERGTARPSWKPRSGTCPPWSAGAGSRTPGARRGGLAGVLPPPHRRADRDAAYPAQLHADCPRHPLWCMPRQFLSSGQLHIDHSASQPERASAA